MLPIRATSGAASPATAGTISGPSASASSPPPPLPPPPPPPPLPRISAGSCCYRCQGRNQAEKTVDNHEHFCQLLGFWCCQEKCRTDSMMNTVIVFVLIVTVTMVRGWSRRR